jgi:hypothetical protein
MNRNITDIRVDINITAMYGNFNIKITNTHKRSLLYKVSEENDKTGWEEVPYSASAYILEDFKKTSEHKEMLDILNVATKDYGY